MICRRRGQTSIRWLATSAAGVIATSAICQQGFCTVYDPVHLGGHSALSFISGASAACVDLDAYTSEGSGSSGGYSPVLIVEKNRVSVSSVNSGDGEQANTFPEWRRFQPLKRPTSLVNNSDSQIVVESPSHYEALAVPVAILALLDSVA